VLCAVILKSLLFLQKIKPDMIDIRLSDNLELMAEMQDNTVDLIYCDILYGTGKDFIDYKDLYPMREIIEKHYIPRIKEMYRILKDTGSIYLQMDNKINHWVRCIMDDVFGYGNFLNEIYWDKNVVKNNTKNKFTNSTDTIILYTKTKNYTFNPQYENIISKSTLNEFKYNDNQELVRMARTRDYKTKGKKEIKLKDYKGRLCNNIFNIAKRLKQVYATQKPKALIERIIKASSNEGDLVADFYAGSFTTAEVCKDLNRNFIGCDISKKAVAIGLERTKY
jgi:site-specific DNA-methyltransferase (adenine-specific)